MLGHVRAAPPAVCVIKYSQGNYGYGARTSGIYCYVLGLVGGAAGFRARENFLHCRSARPSGLGEPCSAPAASSPRAAGVVVALALFARVASTPPDVEDDVDELLRSQAASATPVGDDDDVSAAFGCTSLDCCAPLLCSTSSSVALLAPFFALRKNDICQ